MSLKNDMWRLNVDYRFCDWNAQLVVFEIITDKPPFLSVIFVESNKLVQTT